MTFKDLQRVCMALPEVEERETWGDATFRVRNKIFAISSPDGDTASIKASLDDQSGLVAMDPDTFAVAAYTGKYGWVRVRLAGVPPELAERLIKNAWRRTAPRRLVTKLEEGP
ncbi:MAG TPA: MmcQ/YjbR family DNA-binding protein [Candidatus Dormibacteraeota bacterium]|jgi:hypothetical protein